MFEILFCQNRTFRALREDDQDQFDQLMCFFMHTASAVDIYRAQRKRINYSI
jgi:hypothetical protein